MFNILKLFFKKPNDNFYCEKELNNAIDLQLQGNLEIAHKKYQKLYTEFKKRNQNPELAIVINNLISLKKSLNQPSLQLYKELLELRFKLFLKNEEQYAKDYIYTLIMGVDWFNKPKEQSLQQAKNLLNHYNNKEFYSDAIEKIKHLERLSNT